MCDSQNKLELPKEIGDKILSMLKITARPACVLIFEEDRISFKSDALCNADRDFIMQLDKHREWGTSGIEYVDSEDLSEYPDNQVHAALMLGFRFQDDASRARWKSGEDFEMYRDTVHGFA
jgi:hypothetical protein